MGALLWIARSPSFFDHPSSGRYEGTQQHGAAPTPKSSLSFPFSFLYYLALPHPCLFGKSRPRFLTQFLVFSSFKDFPPPPSKGRGGTLLKASSSNWEWKPLSAGELLFHSLYISLPSLFFFFLSPCRVVRFSLTICTPFPPFCPDSFPFIGFAFYCCSLMDDQPTGFCCILFPSTSFFFSQDTVLGRMYLYRGNFFLTPPPPPSFCLLVSFPPLPFSRS